MLISSYDDGNIEILDLASESKRLPWIWFAWFSIHSVRYITGSTTDAIHY